MTAGEAYRIKAAELRARARGEADAGIRADLLSLAQSYLRLAEQADRNTRIDISYETPPRRGESGPEHQD